MNEAMWKREGEGAHSVREITQSVDKDCSTHNYLSAEHWYDQTSPDHLTIFRAVGRSSRRMLSEHRVSG
jgi:hypothetical protein